MSLNLILKSLIDFNVNSIETNFNNISNNRRFCGIYCENREHLYSPQSMDCFQSKFCLFSSFVCITFCHHFCLQKLLFYSIKSLIN